MQIKNFLPAILFTLLCAAPLLNAQENAQQQGPIKIEPRYGTNAAAATEAPADYTEEITRAIEEIAPLIKKNNRRSCIEAISNIRSYLNQGIEDTRMDTLMAQAYHCKGDFDSAIYYANQAIALQPSNVEAYTTRAEAYYKIEDITKAKEDVETALKLNPRYSYAEELKQKIFVEKTSLGRAKANAARRSGRTLPSWFFVYIVCVVFVMVFFIVLRYRGYFQPLKDKHGRRIKEVNLKEQYNFIRSIGEGGMGKVYEAYDNTLKRKVAVKRIKPELLRSSTVREQFLSEARMVAMLRSPYIVEIYTVIETINSLYLVFEYVDGQTLETRLDIDNYIQFTEAKEIFSMVCKGLAYAHSKNIVHCDLKPGNIMISDSGLAKVMDFGVARKLTEGKTDSSSIAGTPAYMSPEQQKGEMSKQSDIYSLAVCLYEALVGQVPWSVQGYDLTTKKIVPPSSISPAVPKSVDYLIETSLNEDPSLRIQTVEEFWDILKDAQPVQK